MTTILGRVLAVNTSIAGDELVADTLAGATSLTVDDTVDFSDTGGYLTINDETLPYESVDDDTGVITLAFRTTTDETTGVTTTTRASISADAFAGDRVEIFDSQAGTPAQEVVAMVALEGSDFNDDAIEAIVDHALVPLLPEGIRDEGVVDEAQVALGAASTALAGETVVLVWRGSQAFVTDVLTQAATLSSTEAGWSLDDTGASFENVDIAGEVGADIITANSLTLGGQDFSTEVFDALPKGGVYYANIANGHTADIGATNLALFTFNLGVLPTNRRYLVLASFHVAATTDGDNFDFRFNYDRNGVVLGSTVGGSDTMDGSLTRWVAPGGGYADAGAHMQGYFETSDSWGAIQNGLPVHMQLQGVRAAGTGTAYLYLTDLNRSLQVQVIDIGSTLVGYSNSWSQKSKATGTADAAPKSTYTKTWTAGWGQSYDGDNGKRTGDTSGDLYQGYYSGTHGNTKSAWGFTDAAAGIRTALSGATISKITMTFRVKHSYNNSGTTFYIKTHNSTATGEPSTMPGGLATVYTKTSGTSGTTYTVTLPNSVATSLQNGTIRGFALSTGSTSHDYYGYWYGVGSGSAPKITITYSK